MSYLGSSPVESPYVQFVLPLIPEIAPLRYAVAASAACHWAARIQDAELERQSLRLRLEATKALRQRLKSKHSTDYGSLASMMMLAQLDVWYGTTLWMEMIMLTSFAHKMCSRDTGEFEIHLNGAKSIIKHHKSSSPGAIFFEQRLTWYVIIELPNCHRC